MIGGKRIDQTVVDVFLEATTPCAADAARQANEEAHRESEALRLYWAHQTERVRYEAQRAERQYLAVEPENRVVARELERRWEQALKELERVRAEAGQAVASPELLSVDDLEKVHLLGQELHAVWNEDSTTNRDRKRLLRCLIEEVQLSTGEDHYAVRIVWKGGATTERELVRGPAGWARRTPEDTVELVRQLAAQFDDAQIARILNKQGRRSGRGIPFTQAAITSLRGKNKIAKYEKIVTTDPRQGPFNAEQAARELGVTMSTVHRWLRDGVLAGEQLSVRRRRQQARGGPDSRAHPTQHSRCETPGFRNRRYAQVASPRQRRTTERYPHLCNGRPAGIAGRVIGPGLSLGWDQPSKSAGSPQTFEQR